MFDDEVADQVGLVRDQRLRDGHPDRADELRLVGLGVVARHGRGPVDNPGRRDLDPGAERVVDLAALFPLRRGGRQPGQLGQVTVVHQSGVDRRDVPQPERLGSDLDGSGEAVGADLEREVAGDGGTLVEEPVRDVQLGQLEAHPGQRLLGRDSTEQDHPVLPSRRPNARPSAASAGSPCRLNMAW